MAWLRRYSPMPDLRSHGHIAMYCYKQYSDHPLAQANLAVSGGSPTTTTVFAWYPDTGSTTTSRLYSALEIRAHGSSHSTHTTGNSRVFLLVYVDDIIMMGNDPALIDTLLHRLSTTFKIRDLGTPGFFLGIETLKVDGGLFLSQRRYMGDILTRAGMSDCKSLATLVAVTQAATPSTHSFDNPTQYCSIIGALQYLTIIRPDHSYAVNRLCQFMHSPTDDHWGFLKRVLRYVKGTQDYGLRLSASSSSDIHIFSDSDWAGCPTDRKSTSGYAVFLGSNLISWLSRK
ncbi:PREDICTED: uncharacterized protein LOC109168450 [Ipomoea nil]|uniref:uncharacterized protein LOC109168450 n=1 Tax=Ipomoea nil TaxID=35883 RepID=UPI000900B093|nr:PREDICTED: uncharacterized protein LOC109168450 [Ipomoea nil]